MGWVGLGWAVGGWEGLGWVVCLQCEQSPPVRVSSVSVQCQSPVRASLQCERSPVRAVRPSSCQLVVVWGRHSNSASVGWTKSPGPERPSRLQCECPVRVSSASVQYAASRVITHWIALDTRTHWRHNGHSRLDPRTGHLHWTVALDTRTGHSHWTLALVTRSGHSHWTLALDTRTGHSHWTLTLDTRTGHLHWTLAVNTRAWTLALETRTGDSHSELLALGRLLSPVRVSSAAVSNASSLLPEGSSAPARVASSTSSLLPCEQSPVQQCESPVRVSSASLQCESPVRVSSASLQCESPVRVFSASLQCESPVRVSSASLQCESPVRVSSASLQCDLADCWHSLQETARSAGNCSHWRLLALERLAYAGVYAESSPASTQGPLAKTLVFRAPPKKYSVLPSWTHGQDIQRHIRPRGLIKTPG
jgi:hypothetical protein